MISESADQRTFFLGLGRSKVYQLRTNARHNPWQKIDESKIKLELPAGKKINIFCVQTKHFHLDSWIMIFFFILSSGTLIYAEIVTEMRGECKSMRRATAIHIIDALFIGGEDIRGRDFMTRNQYIQMLAKAVNKPTRSDYVVLRPKEIHSLERLDELIGMSYSYNML